MFLNKCLSKTHDGGTPTNCLDSAAAAAAAEPRKKKNRRPHRIKGRDGGTLKNNSHIYRITQTKNNLMQ